MTPYDARSEAPSPAASGVFDARLTHDPEPAGAGALNGHLGTLLGIPSHPRTGTRDGAAREAFAFPLRQVRLRVRLLADCATTELEEHFANTSSEVMDVTHTIPLPPDAAVSGFELMSGDRRVLGTCMETAKAQQAFDDAVERGKTAAMVESVRGDLHTISLGQVAPGSDIIVRLRITQRLRVDEGRFEYRFPTALSPKYVPHDMTTGVIGHAGDGWAPDTTRAPDASRLTPPVRLDGGTPLDLDIMLPAEVTAITSSVPLAGEADPQGFLALRPSAPLTCAGDLVIRAWTRSATGGARAYTDGARTLVILDPPAKSSTEAELPCDAVFVLDRSGSMEGERLKAAKAALLAAIDGLTERDRFEIIAFDTLIERFRDAPTPATALGKLEAAAWLAGIDARGGTEVLPALHEACGIRAKASRVRVVFLLTDGAVGNDREVLALTRRIDPSIRLHTIGIGCAPSMELLGRLARLARGTSLEVRDGEDIAHEIRRFQTSFRGPLALDLRIVGDGRSIETAPIDLFAGRSSTRLIEGTFERIEARSPDGSLLHATRVLRSPIDLGALWAHERVCELEDRIVTDPTSASDCERAITALGLTHQIQTRFTRFVAIDEASQVDGVPLRVVQPTDVPDDARRFRMQIDATRRQCIDPSIRYAMLRELDTIPRCATRRPGQNRVGSPKWMLHAFADLAPVPIAGASRIEEQIRMAVERIGHLDPTGPLTLGEALIVVVATLDPTARVPIELRERARAAIEAAIAAEPDREELRCIVLETLASRLAAPTDGVRHEEVSRELILSAVLNTAGVRSLDELDPAPEVPPRPTGKLG